MNSKGTNTLPCRTPILIKLCPFIYVKYNNYYHNIFSKHEKSSKIIVKF